MDLLLERARLEGGYADDDEAEAALEGLDDPQSRAMRASIRFEHAEADAALSGWWLVEEHRAEALRELGRLDEALALYERVVKQTGSPELMGAYAETLALAGRQGEADAYNLQATKAFAELLADFPEAAGGHALDHLLIHGEPGAVLALAKANAARRPNGEALLQLAEAHERVGEAAEADRLRKQVVASGWYVHGG